MGFVRAKILHSATSIDPASGGHGVAVVRIVAAERARAEHKPRMIRVAGIRTAQPLKPGIAAIIVHDAVHVCSALVIVPLRFG